jgi:hypothetical protein
MHLTLARPIAASLLGMSLLACGGSASDRSTTPEPEGASAHVEPVPPERPWAELSMDERRAHMARHVVPVMSELFAGYDAERFPDVSCGTCHGENAHERGFAMPNPDLPALYPTGSIGQYQTVERFPEGARFMFSQVMPAMQTLLGAESFDPATGEGFSCYGCHPHAADDDPLSAPAPTAALDGVTRF